MPLRRLAWCALAVAVVGVVVDGCACGPPPLVGGRARCNFDGDCVVADGERCLLGFCTPASPPAPVSDAGPSDAGVVDAGLCGEGEHPAGDGTCLPLGACAEGFAPAFADGDGDGVGDGPLGEDCLPLPAPAGFASVDGDCDDADGSVSALAPFFADDDADTFTTGVVERCAPPGSPPAGTTATERLAPALLFGADAVGGAGGPNGWADIDFVGGCCGGATRADVDSDAATRTLLIEDWQCLAVPERVDVVRVHWRAAVSDDGPVALNTDVALTLAGVPGTPRSLVATWDVGDGVDLYVEASPADWGVPALDPIAACDGTLGVQLTVGNVVGGTFTREALVDFVSLEIEGVTECAPADVATFAPLAIYGDADDDGARGGAPLSTCQPAEPLRQPEAVFGPDCDDGDGDTFPGQTAFFVPQRAAGGWDYNCDGEEEPRAVVDDTSCTFNADAGVCNVASTNRTGACGADVDADDCNASCVLAADTDPIACR